MPTKAEDRDEILQLLYRYNHAIDSRDPHEWADTFIDDAVFEALGDVMIGRDELVAWASNVRGMRHVITNPVVEVIGKAATLQAYVLVWRGKELSVTGSYQDELERTAAGWRFAKRTFTMD